MAIKNTKLGGTDLVNGDNIDADNWNDTFDATFSTTYHTVGYKKAGYPMCFSEDVWCMHQQRTTDGGQTWAGDVALDNIRAVSRANEVNGIFCDQAGAGNEQYTTDAGANWNAAAVGMANVTNVYNIDFPTASACVAGGTAGAGVPIWYTADGGNNWAQAAVGPATACYAISMFDANNGIADCNNAGVRRLWHTVNGGANWTDTGQASRQGAVHCLNADRDYLDSNIEGGNWGVYKGTILGGTDADPKVYFACISDYTQDYYAGERGFTVTGDGNTICISMVHFFNVEATNRYQYLTGMLTTKDEGDTWNISASLPSVNKASQGWSNPKNTYAIGSGNKIWTSWWDGAGAYYIFEV